MNNLIAFLFVLIGFLTCFTSRQVCLAGGQEQSAAGTILSWGDCLAEAEKNHPDLISAAEGINIKKAGRDVTASGLYPQFSASVGASTAQTSTASAGKSTSDSYSYGIDGSQLIFDGFKTVNDLKAADEDINVAWQSYRFTSAQVRRDLRGAFINLLKAQELIKVAEEIVNIRRDNLMLLTMQYQAGLEHKGALLTAEANAAEANFGLAQAKRSAEFAQIKLTQEMGRREFVPLSVKGEFVAQETAAEKPDFEQLAKSNPAVLEAAAQKNSALFAVKSAFGNFAPQLSGTAGADRKSAHWPPENNQWDLGLSLTLPLFEGGLKAAQLSSAQAVYRQKEADERSARDTALVTLEQTWAALRDAIGTVDVQDKLLEAAEERAQIAEAQYSTGFISFDNWVIIENDLVKAKKSYLQSQADALLAEADWIQAKGETLEYAR
ncbi:MAG: TolC family protein [Candidatus Omnitrophota bacterium]